MRPNDEREREIDEKIAEWKRRKKELRASNGAAERKTRTRALILIGGVVAKQFANKGQFTGYIKNLTASMPEKDREILAEVYPDVFASAQAQEATNA